MADDDTTKKRPAAKRAPKKKKAVLTAPEAPADIFAPPHPWEVSGNDIARLLGGDFPHPHDILGAHPMEQDGQSGVIVRALTPNAVRGECILDDGRVLQFTRVAEGLS